MNDQNLIPMMSRSAEERKRITSKGGTASSEIRRTKKKMRKMVQEILFKAEVDPDLKRELMEFGFTEPDICLMAGILMRLAKKALQGDLPSIRTLFEYSGDDPMLNLRQEELRLKKADLGLKKDLVKQQTIKLKKFNFGDGETNWILSYNPADDPMLQVLQQLVEDDPEPNEGFLNLLEVHKDHSEKILKEQQKLKEDPDTSQGAQEGPF